MSFSGSCYWLVSNANLLTTWHEAHAKCSDMGAHLLILNRYDGTDCVIRIHLGLFTSSTLYRSIFFFLFCPWLFPLLCAAKKNSSSSTGNFQTSTRWTSLIFGSVYQVPNTLRLAFFPLYPHVRFHERSSLTDKDQDGHFRWVDKSEVTYSNYGPGWPQNTANIWDCGQIFTGGNAPSVRGGRNPKTEVLFRFQGITTACGKRPTASRAWVTFAR